MSVISVFFRNYEYVNETNSVHLLLSRFCFIVIHIFEGNFIALVAWITKILRLDRSKIGISCIQFPSFFLLLIKVTLKIIKQNSSANMQYRSNLLVEKSFYLQLSICFVWKNTQAAKHVYFTDEKLPEILYRPMPSPKFFSFLKKIAHLYKWHFLMF